MLLAALSKVAPDIPVVAEERISAGAACEYARRFFLVDALDGTRLLFAASRSFRSTSHWSKTASARFGLIFLPPSERLFVTRADGAAYEAQLHLSTREQSPSVEFALDIDARARPAALVAFNSRGAGSASTNLLKTLNVAGRAAARLVDEILPDRGRRRRSLRKVRRNLRVGYRGRPSHTRGGGWIGHDAGRFAVDLRSLRTRIS